VPTFLPTKSIKLKNATIYFTWNPPNMKKYILILLIGLFVFACKSINYQVIEPFLDTSEENGSFFIHHETGIDIIYSFWVFGGTMTFVVYNNSDKPIYIDWKKSSFIYQGSRLTYWEDKEIHNTTGKFSNITLSGASILSLFSPFTTASIGIGSFKSLTMIEKEERITFIPPKSKYLKSSYILATKPFSMKNATVMKVNRTDKPKKTTKIKVLEFDKNSSPLSFRNYITWSYDENFVVENHIDDEFYVKKITSMHDYHFAGKMVRDLEYEIPFASPKKFCIQY